MARTSLLSFVAVVVVVVVASSLHTARAQSPDGLPDGLLIHLDALTHESLNFDDAGRVAVWANRADAYATLFTQATAASRPSLISTGGNTTLTDNRPAVSFNGVAQWLQGFRRSSVLPLTWCVDGANRTSTEFKAVLVDALDLFGPLQVYVAEIDTTSDEQTCFEFYLLGLDNQDDLRLASSALKLACTENGSGPLAGLYPLLKFGISALDEPLAPTDAPPPPTPQPSPEPTVEGTDQPTPAPMNCCQADDDRLGCNDRGIEQCVCRRDSFCCTRGWDAICALQTALCPQCFKCGNCAEAEAPEPETDAIDIVAEVSSAPCTSVISWNTKDVELSPQAFIAYYPFELGPLGQGKEDTLPWGVELLSNLAGDFWLFCPLESFGPVHSVAIFTDNSFSTLAGFTTFAWSGADGCTSDVFCTPSTSLRRKRSAGITSASTTTTTTTLDDASQRHVDSMHEMLRARRTAQLRSNMPPHVDIDLTLAREASRRTLPDNEALRAVEYGMTAEQQQQQQQQPAAAAAVDFGRVMHAVPIDDEWVRIGALRRPSVPRMFERTAATIEAERQQQQVGNGDATSEKRATQEAAITAVMLAQRPDAGSTFFQRLFSSYVNGTDDDWILPSWSISAHRNPETGQEFAFPAEMLITRVATDALEDMKVAAKFNLANFAKYDLFELLVFDHDLSLDELNDVMSYLNARWTLFIDRPPPVGAGPDDMLVWYDAWDQSTVLTTKDSNNDRRVMRWVNKGSRATIDAKGVAEFSRPVFNPQVYMHLPGIVTGYPGIVFDGVNHFLEVETDNGSVRPGVNVDGVTRGTGGYHCFIAMWRPRVEPGDFFYQRLLSSSTKLDDDNTAPSWNVAGQRNDDGSERPMIPTIISQRRATDLVDPSNNFLIDNVILGAQGNLNRKSRVTIFEVLIYNDRLNEDDELAVIEYLKAKWSIIQVIWQ